MSSPSVGFSSFHDAPRVLVTIPARNESARLASTIARVETSLRNSRYQWQLAVAEDGSEDGSAELVRDLARSDPNLLVQSSAARLGRGLALRRLWSAVESDIYVFTDADLASGPEAIIAAIREVERGADLAIGSRLLRESKVLRPPLRHWVSRGYNWIVRRMFGDRVADHQCGLKAFSHRAVLNLIPLTSEDCWFWDTEVVVRAYLGGFRVTEFPVEWCETKYARTPIRRLISDLWLHGVGLLRLIESLSRTRVESVSQSHLERGAGFKAGANQRPRG